MKRIGLFLSLLLVLTSPLAATPSRSAQNEVQEMRIWVTPGHLRLVLYTKGRPVSRLYPMSDPERLVLDMRNTRLMTPLPSVAADLPALDRIRTGVHGRNLRVVLDLKQRVKAKTFSLPGHQAQGPQVVIDLDLTGVAQTAPAPAQANPPLPTVTANAPASPPPPPSIPLADRPRAPSATQGPAPARIKATAPHASGHNPTRKVAERSAPVARPAPTRRLTIAIDAGHGGEDPGAVGPSGVQEKDVVMAIARQLARQVNAQPGMRAVMIRAADDYLPLRQRIHKARAAKADLFVSIHADASPNAEAGGASVYTLSQRGASSEAARLLAKKENSADLVRGMELDGKDEVLASVLLDMSQSGAMEASQRAARHVLRNLKRVGKTHQTQVQYAAFAVLKAPDIPSMLVETAFISNPEEEAKLRDPAYQRRLARAVLGGIKDYFQANPAPETRMAAGKPQRRHTIGQGESLSVIAERYRVDLRTLRGANNLAGDEVRVGQVLTIPES